MTQEDKGWEVREEEIADGGTKIKVAPEGVEALPEPTIMGEIPVSHEMALKLLATVAWEAHGDREAAECAHYIYLDDVAAVTCRLDVRCEHFIHGDGSEEQGGQGIRIVMTPKQGVSAEDLPETELDEDA